MKYREFFEVQNPFYWKFSKMDGWIIGIIIGDVVYQRS